MIRKVCLAGPRGFCAGVVRAIDVVKIALDVYRNPIYVRKEIVHNPHVVKELSRKGAIFVETVEEVPDGGTVIFSAHGVAPDVWTKSQAKSLHIIDATCPLVTKVHMEAIRYARQNYTTILIGHVGHDEVIGTMGEAPHHIKLVSTVREVEDVEVEDPQRVAYLTQTTLSLEDTREIVEALRERFPDITGPPSNDICYATQNRQIAVRELASRCDLILVVGAVNSSNSNRLVEEAERSGTAAYLINNLGSIQENWLKECEILGVTSGASAPERLVQEVVTFFREKGAVIENLTIREEDVHFSLPPDLLTDLQPHKDSLES